MAELAKSQALRERYMCRESWFASQHARGALKPVAYFGMDFGASARRCLYTPAYLGSGRRLSQDCR